MRSAGSGTCNRNRKFEPVACQRADQSSSSISAMSQYLKQADLTFESAKGFTEQIGDRLAVDVHQFSNLVVLY